MARLVLLLTLVLSTLASACVIDEAEGDLRVFWVFPGTLDCFDAGVEVVRITLFDEFGVVGTVDEFCDRGPVVFGDLDVGTYELELLGFPPRGEPTWLADRIFIDVRGGSNEFTVILEEL